MNINPDTLGANRIYHIITQTLIPRPIAWVLTENIDRNYNLAPFSYFTAVSSSPPLLLLSIGKKPDGSEKDTRVNIKRTGKLVIHMAHQQQAELLNASSAHLAYGESEIDKQALPLVPFENFSLPRLAECYIAYGCDLYEYSEIANTGQAIIYAEIKSIFIDDKKVEVVDKERLKINAEGIDPLCRLGGSEYAGLTETFTIKRPK